MALFASANRSLGSRRDRPPLFMTVSGCSAEGGSRRPAPPLPCSPPPPDMPQQRSAGILLYRRGEAGLQVLLGHPGGPYWARKDAGAWMVPKGLVDRGETMLATALREFTEETGFSARGPFIPLSSVKQKSGKTVRAFACKGDFDPEQLACN